jgi:hypothetical protein
MRKAWIVGVFVLGVAWAVAAQTLEGVAGKVEEIRVEAQTVLDRNATLKPKSRLPAWVTDAMTRIVGVAESAALDIQTIIIRNRLDPDNPTPGVTCDSTSDGSNEDTQTKVTAATTGQTVCIPGGTFEWSGSPPYVLVDKSIKIIGAGKGTKAQCEVPSQTTYTCITGTVAIMIWDSPLTGEPELGHMTFIASSCSNCTTYGVGVVNIFGRNPNFRLHDIGVDFDGGGYTGLQVYRGVRGVGWNISGVQRRNDMHIAAVLHGWWNDSAGATCPGNEGCGDDSWASPSTIGTADSWYWEDVEFTIGPGFSEVGYCTDDFYGARVHVRFSTMPNCSWQNHGTETGGRVRGMRETVYSHNNWSNTIAAWPGMFGWRGGSGLAHHNVVTSSGSGSFTYVMSGTTFRRHDTSHNNGLWQEWNRCGEVGITSITRSGTTATVTVSDSYSGVSQGGSWVTISGATGADASLYNGTFLANDVAEDPNLLTVFTYTMAGTPTGSATGTLKAKSPFDGNVDSTGRRCLDGFGVGESVEIRGELSGTTINGVSVATATLAESASQPVYVWSNTHNGSQVDTGWSGDVTVANRDVFNQNASYNGTTQLGIYVGTTLPTNCTAGDAAWITTEGSWNTETSAIHANHGSNHTEGADGKLYIATATGAPCTTWTAKYGVSTSGEPYAYPHPLRAGIP